ncbi:hypothetical protein pipiens_001945 [Culex pipiens pipiens]|uniref:Uncharacterized protein n=1 Tax=Culex pipiens pipiens TaxID=38569 RepID=A0ABD1DP21_CULPP
MSAPLISWFTFILLLVIPAQSLKVPTREQFLSLEETCADILGVSDDLRAQIRQHRYPDTPESHQFTYCTAVLFFDYKPAVGLNMDLMYAVFGQDEGRQQFGRAKKDCFERNGAYQEGLTRFESLYRMYRCFADRYASFFASDEVKSK